MCRPLMWPFSERRVTKDPYIEIIQKFVNQYTDVGLKNIKFYNFFVKERSHMISRVYAALVRAGKGSEVGRIRSMNEIYEKQIV